MTLLVDIHHGESDPFTDAGQFTRMVINNGSGYHITFTSKPPPIIKMVFFNKHNVCVVLVVL